MVSGFSKIGKTFLKELDRLERIIKVLRDSTTACNISD